MSKVFRLCITFVLALIFLTTTIVSTGCPSQSGIEKAAKTSLRISDLTRDAIAATKRAYEGHVISLETKDKMAAQLDLVIAGGQTFNSAVQKAYEEYKKTGNKDVNALHLLDAMLTSKVITPFLAFLQLMGAVTPEQAPYLWAAVNALRAALLLIGSFVGYNSVKMLDSVDNRASIPTYENKIALGGRYLYVRKFC